MFQKAAQQYKTPYEAIGSEALEEDSDGMGGVHGVLQVLARKMPFFSSNAHPLSISGHHVKSICLQLLASADRCPDRMRQLAG